MSKSALPSITLWGCYSRQTAVTLHAMLKAKLPVRRLVLAQTPLLKNDPKNDRLPLVTVPTVAWQHNAAVLAQQAGIPILHIPQRRSLGDLTRELTPHTDLAVVSCFPWRIPTALLSHYSCGALNIHPSLLPSYRGAAPLFWQYRDGRLNTGVSVHWVTHELDAGPIAAQAHCTLPLALPGDRLEAWLAWYGVALLRTLLPDIENAPHLPQPETPRVTAPYPDEQACLVDASWPAWRAAHFLAGILPLGYQASLRDQDGRHCRPIRFLGWYGSKEGLPLHCPPSVLAAQLRDGTLLIEAVQA